MNNQAKFPPTHPGKILERRFFQPRNLTTEKVSQDTNLPLYQLQDLIEGKSRIDADIAYRLGLYFQVDPEGFLNLQQIYDFAIWKDRQAEIVKKQVHPYHKTQETRFKTA
ncbi:HigA family addiction module antitoxin [endosymbiont GvMRE of Glomus versiforme]|uniref:HigA family addiction module antitoxin n=1 Tax=endosymbiont GvMRE of Glomus versiforme TaxID=2039283 RepID=UPI000EB8FD06|nr:HigA family addiction module antitoxin [endosymbiont GvMRE of Glomus versiforme]RHZ36232.1 Addiction module antidote protein, HigA family [endosymbiont GvMRE of Glomus versiforme]